MHETWVEQLGRDLGRPELSIAGGAVPYLALENDLEIGFEADPATGALCLHTVLPRPFLGVAEEGPYLERLLIANHVDEHGLGAALSVDATSGDTLLWRMIEPDEVEDYDAFARLVGAFVERAAELAAGGTESAPEADPVTTEALDPLAMMSRFIRV